MQYTWRLATLLGGLVAAIGLVTMAAFPTDGAGYPAGYGTPIYAFEMARNAQDLILIFGTADDPARGERIAGMDAGNLWDYPFMLAYGLFIACFFWAVAQTKGQGTWKLFAVMGIAAALSDGIENQILLAITDDIEAARGIAWLRYPVWIKFGLLSLCNAGVALFCWQQGGVVWRGLGILIALGALITVPASLNPAEYGGLLGNGIAIGWLSMLGAALVYSFRTESI